MEFIDLKKQQSRIKDKIDANIENVLGHGRYILGPEVKELEKRLADFTGRKHAIGVSNGSDALIMSLMALGIGKGDAVFVPDFTYIATASSVSFVGAEPVFVDIKEKTFNIDPLDLEKQIEFVKEEGKLKLKAIIAVDLFGQTADFSKINKIAKKYNLKVIEDAAQSMGAKQGEKRACAFGDIATTSFFPAKPLGCYGDGGMIFTDSAEIKDKLLSIRVHGKGEHKYDNVRLGINGRLSTMQAAILLAKMDIFEEEIELRQKAADYYNDNLRDFIDVPEVETDNLSVWAQYTLRSENREKIREALKAEGIPTAIYYPKALHEQDMFAGQNKYKENKVVKNFTKQVFSIPMHPYLERKDQDKIINVIKKNI